MGFMSFLGRALFASIFILSAYQEWDGFNRYFFMPRSLKRAPAYAVPHATNEQRGQKLMVMMFKEFGVDGRPAAKTFRPKYNQFRKHVATSAGVQVPKVEIKHLIAAGIAMTGIGGILFIIISSFGAELLLLHLAAATPILYDFYNYDSEKPQFAQLFNKFTQNLALVGALVFCIAMKNSVPKKQTKNKVTKAKTM